MKVGSDTSDKDEIRTRKKSKSGDKLHCEASHNRFSPNPCKGGDETYCCRNMELTWKYGRNGSRSWEGGSGCIIIVAGGCNSNGLTACACTAEFSMSSSSSSSCVHACFR